MYTDDDPGRLFQVLSLFLLQELGRRFGVKEEVVDFFDLVLAYLVLAVDSGQDARRGQQLNSVSRKEMTNHEESAVDILPVQWLYLPES